MKITIEQLYKQQFIRDGLPEGKPENIPRYQFWLRKISPYLSWTFVNVFHMRAHHVNMFRIIVTISGAILLGTANLYLMVVGGLLLIFAHFIDMCDGEIARATKDVTLMGTQIEMYDHKISGRLFHFAMCFSVFLATGKVYMIIVGIISSVFYGSLVFETLVWELVHTRLWEIRTGKKQFKIKEPKEVEYIGKTNRIAEFIEKSKINFLYTDPHDKLLWTGVLLFELVNKLFLHILNPFVVLNIMLPIYAACYLLLQISSFYFNIIKKPAIDDYYYTLFYKNNKEK